MNLQESIRRILREEDFDPLEDLNTVIKDHEDGFDVFIMNGDKKIGEISFAKESIPNLYTIVDATMDDKYKGNRIYPKTIINLFKERPNIIINSLFRSPEAEKAWIYILSNLPSNIGKSVKYYKDEDTTLYQLKLRNIQESIRRILREERSLKSIVRDLVKNKGFLRASNVIGSLEKVHKILELKGTQEDMMFIVNTILKHDLNEPICNFVVSKWFHSIRTLVNIPLRDPNNLDAWINRSIEIDLEEKIRDMVYELGKGIVRGNDIKVSSVWC